MKDYNLLKKYIGYVKAVSGNSYLSKYEFEKYAEGDKFSFPEEDILIQLDREVEYELRKPNNPPNITKPRFSLFKRRKHGKSK